MSLITLSLKHEKTFEEARHQLVEVVQQIQSLFGMMVQQIEWSTDRSEVRLNGTGFRIEMSVDDTLVYITGDLPLLGHLLGSRVSTSIQQIVQKAFQKQLR